jgi:hypothetical protein
MTAATIDINGVERNTVVGMIITMDGKGLPTRKRDEFVRQGGHSCISELLEKAGYSGDWTFRICAEPCKGSSGQPAVQVRKPEKNYVSLWVKPKGNDSAVRGKLICYQPNDPHVVYERLTAANADNVASCKKQNGKADHVETVVTDAQATELLNAVVLEAGDPNGHITDFVAKLAARLKMPTDVCLEWATKLENECFLAEEQNRYALTDKGREFLSREDKTVKIEEPAPETNGEDHIKILLRNKSRLAQTLATLERVEEVDKQVEDFDRQIADARIVLETLEEQRRGLMDEREALTEGIDQALVSALK